MQRLLIVMVFMMAPPPPIRVYSIRKIGLKVGKLCLKSEKFYFFLELLAAVQYKVVNTHDDILLATEVGSARARSQEVKSAHLAKLWRLAYLSSRHLGKFSPLEHLVSVLTLMNELINVFWSYFFAL